MILELLGKQLLFFDGAMGSLLQEQGLQAGELPELWNLTKPDVITTIHEQYLEAGSQVILTNTFGANRIKYEEEDYELKKIIQAAVLNAKTAIAHYQSQEKMCFIGLDVGPTGKLLKPLGNLGFEEAYDVFREVMEYGAQAGADFIQIETMTDTYEAKAAILAAKEGTKLPVFVTMVFDEHGRLLTGGDIPSMVAMLEGLRVDALGINCGLGPKQMMPILETLSTYTSLPIIVKPNAGLPKEKDGITYYDISPEEFAQTMKKIVEKGACCIGGCCGTTALHIKQMVEACKECKIILPTYKNHTLVSSYGTVVEIGHKPIIIGERINPTGKKMFKKALKEQNIDYILREAIAQQEAGAHVLDVNVGLPEINESATMCHAIAEIQSVTNLPLQIDTVDIQTMESAMRIYHGKPMVNSVTGTDESMERVFPLIQKYGGVVIGLTIDENGIPATAKQRVAIAKRIIQRGKTYGVQPKDIIIDVLAMTISADPQGAAVTLEALELVEKECMVNTVLGVSNISFGLPNRPLMNGYFYAMAMQKGLKAGIINPLCEQMIQAYDSYCALMNYDENCKQYIQHHTTIANEHSHQEVSAQTLYQAIKKGMKEDTREWTITLLKEMTPLEIIKEHLVPALDDVGKGFENGTIFLPQLMMSAETAKVSFGILQEAMLQQGNEQEKKEKIILATVKGDVHDIGKNIVKVLLENYGFEVLDLGKDVEPELIVSTVQKYRIPLVGLSALMTTTVVNMEKTIRLLKEQVPECFVMVGGAVLNQEYADKIGADFYGKDAMQSVYYAQNKLLNTRKEEI
ncbi:MAG: homocysteine S-methyltransferase family protein [Lachnospiraceae bacterium]